MSKPDIAYVREARRAWNRVLALQDSGCGGSTLAVSAGLWATLNADRLLDLAEQAARSQTQGPSA